MTKAEILKRLDELREEYKTKPGMRKVLEIRGNLLKIALERMEGNQKKIL